MDDKNNPLANAELATEQNANMIDGIMNNAPMAPPTLMPEVKPLDRVKEPPKRSRGRDRDDR